MKRHFSKFFVAVLLATIPVGCATTQWVPDPGFSAYDLNSFINGGKYAQKADNFIVVLDASSTMYKPVMGPIKLDTAKEMLNRMNETIPDLPFKSGLRVVGKAFDYRSVPAYGITAHDRAAFGQAVSAVKGCGLTPLGAGIEDVAGDLAAMEGHTSVIVVSDGLETERDAVGAVKAMKEKYGDRVCVYPVQVGDNPDGGALMAKLASAGGCGFVTNASNIMEPTAMAGFVAGVLLKELPVEVPKPSDSDGDGVYDFKDRCPDTPRGVAVDKTGCPLDSDGDGVFDHLDKCPDTPAGAKVDERGCWVLKRVHFDFDKFNVKPEYYPVLEEVIAILKGNPALRVEIQGHTDNRGPGPYNQTLSERRAAAVGAYLVDQNIAKERLTSKGFGLSKPIASNDTREGRAKNRRVQLKPMW